MRIQTIQIAVTLSLLCNLASGQTPSSGRQLKFVAIVSRHGVRAPTWTNDQLAQYSAEPWPDFGVAPGFLTTHGRELMELMGAYYHEWFVRDGLLEASGCEDAPRVFIWADSEQRTLETGRAFGRSLLPACAIPTHSLDEGKADPLFDAIAGGLSSIDQDRALKALQDRIGGPPSKILEEERPAFDALQVILTGTGSAARRVLTPGDAIVVRSGAKGAETSGPLNTASTLSEDLLLEYLNGAPNPGWGRLNKDNLSLALRLHGRYSDLTRKTQYQAAARGWNLASHILESLRQAEDGAARAGALGSETDKILVVAGHDTNLANLAGMFGVTWHLESYQADETPPGGALVFSLWFDSRSGKYSVRTRFVAQTLDQMRNAVRLSLATPPAGEDLRMPGCPADDCPWKTFEAGMAEAISRAPVAKPLASGK